MNIITKITLLLALTLTSCQVLSDSREKIVVIDSGVGRNQMTRSFICNKGLFGYDSDDDIEDDHGHGTNIIGLITQEIDPNTQCIVSLKVFKKGHNDNIRYYLKALRLSTLIQSKYVNISMTGKDSSKEEYNYLLQMLKNGTKVIVAAGNEKQNLDVKCDIFPACYKNKFPKQYRKNFYVISSKTTGSGNIGTIVDAYLDGKEKGTPIMTGTSQATAIFTSTLISKQEHYVIRID